MVLEKKNAEHFSNKVSAERVWRSSKFAFEFGYCAMRWEKVQNTRAVWRRRRCWKHYWRIQYLQMYPKIQRLKMWKLSLDSNWVVLCEFLFWNWIQLRLMWFLWILQRLRIWNLLSRRKLITWNNLVWVTAIFLGQFLIHWVLFVLSVLIFDFTVIWLSLIITHRQCKVILTWCNDVLCLGVGTGQAVRQGPMA